MAEITGVAQEQMLLWGISFVWTLMWSTWVVWYVHRAFTKYDWPEWSVRMIDRLIRWYMMRSATRWARREHRHA